MSLNCVYHRNKGMRVVNEQEKHRLIAEEEWVASPLDVHKSSEKKNVSKEVVPQVKPDEKLHRLPSKDLPKSQTDNEKIKENLNESQKPRQPDDDKSSKTRSKPPRRK